MTRREFVLMLMVLGCATPATAQSRGAKRKPPDAITGTWKGEIIPSNAPRGRPVTLRLKHDGKGNVSGTIAGMPNPADVKAGSTFESKTGALKLQLGKTDAPEVLLVLEGAVAKNAASGRVTGELSREFKLTKAADSK
jgi:hypothetical protein